MWQFYKKKIDVDILQKFRRRIMFHENATEELNHEHWLKYILTALFETRVT